MRYLVLILLLTGCEAPNSPENLKRRDANEASCIEQCKPRPMEIIHPIFGCLCVDNQ